MKTSIAMREYSRAEAEEIFGPFTEPNIFTLARQLRDRLDRSVDGKHTETGDFLFVGIVVGDTVIMPEPNVSDNYTFGGWEATVEGVRGDNILVKDNEDNSTEIEPARIHHNSLN